MFRHLIALIIALGLTAVLLLLIPNSGTRNSKRIVRTYTKPLHSTWLNNCSDDSTATLQLAQFLQHKELVLFGSSEFTESPEMPFIFLPKRGIPTLAMGHAYHQCFSMACELLGMQEYLKDSKLCIILSPTWFATDGTNTQAFLEFVPREILVRILLNPSISEPFKQKIGAFIERKKSELSNPNSVIKCFSNRNKWGNIPLINRSLNMTENQLTYPEYQLKKTSIVEHKKPFIDFKKWKLHVQDSFIKANTTNPYYISDAYYTQYVVKDGKFNPAEVSTEFISEKNQELQDFIFLLQVLKKYEVKASFVLQNLHPQGYKNSAVLNDILTKVVQKTKSAGFPILNLYSPKKEDYQPGILRDIMHMGPIGWIYTNQFILNTYYK